MIVEICANSRQSAANALAGGAGRIELCRQLELGGTTPTQDDILYCVQELKLRTHVLVRPRAGDFVYTDAEFYQLCHEVELCRQCGAHAVVVGFLTPDGMIDEARTRHIVQLAAPLQVTFHRAFDEMCQDPLDALEALIRCGCHRLLTSGCQPNAEAGIPTLRQLVRQAAGRITILAGAGITPANARRIVQETGVTEIHGSCKHTLPDGTIETNTETVSQLIKSISQ
jgi:copper homeostasis protein